METTATRYIVDRFPAATDHAERRLRYAPAESLGEARLILRDWAEGLDSLWNSWGMIVAFTAYSDTRTRVDGWYFASDFDGDPVAFVNTHRPDATVTLSVREVAS